MKKLYEKSELWFALLWIFLYCLAEFLANPLSNLIGIDSSAHAILNLLLSAVLLIWVWKNGLTKKYGLCAPCAPAGNFLWYVPLLVLATCNFWNGFAVNLPALDTLADLTLQRHIFFSSIELLVVILYTVFLLIGGKKTSRHEMP